MNQRNSYSLDIDNYKNFKIARMLLISSFVILFVGGQIYSLVIEAITTFTYNQDSNSISYLLKRGGILVMCCISFFTMTFVRLDFLRRIIPAITYFTIVVFPALLLVAGNSAGSNQNSVTLLGFHFQPYEIEKLVMILFFAVTIAEKYRNRNETEPHLYITVGICLIIIGECAFIAKDKGTAAVFVVVFLGLAFTAGFNRKILGGGAITILIIFTAVSLTQDSIKQRIMSAFGMIPGSSVNDQINYSKVGFYYGGLLGKGNSDLPYRYLSESENDFILPVIANMTGLISVIVIILLFVLLLFSLFIFLKIFPGIFEKFAIVGIITWIGSQAIANILVVEGIMPAFGVNLPFISSGGSNQIAFSLAAGFVYNLVWRNSKQFEIEETAHITIGY